MTEPPLLDDVNKRIIDQLQRDGRMSYATLAKQIGLSEAAARQRVQRMLDTGVMQIVAVTDPLTLGFRRQVMIGMKVEGDMRTVADKLAAIAEVDYVVVCAGGYDMLAEMVCTDDEHLLEPAQRPDPGHRRRRQHRNVRLSETRQTDLRLGDSMNHDEQRKRTKLDSCRPRPPVDALHAAVGVRELADPDHRPGRGRLHLGHATASATSTASPGCSSCRPATVGRNSPTPPASRPASWRSSRSGRTRTRRRSSWPTAWPTSPPATSTGSSSPPAAPRPSSRRGSSPAATSSGSASRARSRRSRGTSPTTAPRWARCRSPACPASRPTSSRWCRRRCGCPTPTSTARRKAPPARTAPTRRRSAAGPPTGSPRPSSSRARTRWPASTWSRCRTPAAASRRRPATSSGSARSATSTTCCSSATR